MVIFIISAEETIRIANPCSVNRVGDAALHYKPAGGTIPLPINVLMGEGLDESFVTTATTVTTALPEAPFFTMTNVFIHLPQSGLDQESGLVYPRHSGLDPESRLAKNRS
ncbi:MAG: hypothetical protein LKK12_04335 [Bacteroidales bacterium]|jgi:hypothetical protein|nr:hypothetical protein [Bacteroidales bacterium]MCI2133593.1 hypothetical protein [Bacteroidales bacterium]